MKCITFAAIVIAITSGAWKAYLIYDDYKISTSQIPTHTETTEPEEISNEKID